MASRGSSNFVEKLRIRKAKGLANKKERLAALREKLKNATGPNKVRIQKQIRLLSSKINEGPRKPYTGPKVKHGDSKGHGRKKQYYNQTTKKYQKNDPRAEEKKKRLEESRIKTNKESLKKSEEIGKRIKQNKESGTKEFASWNTKKGNEAIGTKLEDSKIVKRTEEPKTEKTEKTESKSSNNSYEDVDGADKTAEGIYRNSSSVEEAKAKHKNKEDKKDRLKIKSLKNTPKGYIKSKGKFVSLKTNKGKQALKLEKRKLELKKKRFPNKFK